MASRVCDSSRLHEMAGKTLNYEDAWLFGRATFSWHSGCPFWHMRREGFGRKIPHDGKFLHGKTLWRKIPDYEKSFSVLRIFQIGDFPSLGIFCWGNFGHGGLYIWGFFIWGIFRWRKFSLGTFSDQSVWRTWLTQTGINISALICLLWVARGRFELNSHRLRQITRAWPNLEWPFRSQSVSISAPPTAVLRKWFSQTSRQHVPRFKSQIKNLNGSASVGMSLNDTWFERKFKKPHGIWRSGVAQSLRSCVVTSKPPQALITNYSMSHRLSLIKTELFWGNWAVIGFLDDSAAWLIRESVRLTIYRSIGRAISQRNQGLVESPNLSPLFATSTANVESALRNRSHRCSWLHSTRNAAFTPSFCELCQQIEIKGLFST